MSMEQSVIVVDWGTSNFRAWLLTQGSGDLVQEIGDDRGMAEAGS